MCAARFVVFSSSPTPDDRATESLAKNHRRVMNGKDVDGFFLNKSYMLPLYCGLT